MALLLAFWILRECFHNLVQNLEFISPLLRLFTILNETYFSFLSKADHSNGRAEAMPITTAEYFGDGR